MISLAAASQVGPRDENEDVVVLGGLMSAGDLVSSVGMTLSILEPQLVAVVDGMGGQFGGSNAGRIVGRTLARQTWERCDEAAVAELLRSANAAVYAAMDGQPLLRGMGATIAGLVVTQGTAVVFNVGDARVYQHAEGFSVLLTVDDRSASASNVITQSLGGADRPTAIRPHFRHVDVSAGGRFLVCSDGLSDYIPFALIQESMCGPTPCDALNALLEHVSSAVARENVSAVVLDVPSVKEPQ